MNLTTFLTIMRRDDEYTLTYEADKRWYVLRRYGKSVCTGACGVYRATDHAIRVFALSNIRQVIQKSVHPSYWKKVRRLWLREWWLANARTEDRLQTEEVRRSLENARSVVRTIESRTR